MQEFMFLVRMGVALALVAFAAWLAIGQRVEQPLIIEALHNGD